MAATEAFPPGVLHFPEGLPGFEGNTEFALLQDEELQPIVFLQSLGEPQVCFSVLPIQRIDPKYHLRLGDDDRRLLGLPGGPEQVLNVLCLAIVNLGDGAQPASANLFAPIVVNLDNWFAKQVIRFDSAYSAVTEV